MKITHFVVLALRVVLVAAFLLLLLFQVMSLPGQFSHMAAEHPQRAHLQWPLTITASLVVAGIQVVIASTWKLLTMVQHDRIFRTEALVWVDVIMWAIAGALMMLAAFSAIVVFHADDPGVPLLLILMLVAGAALGLVVVVMRALLQQAVELRSDMEGVI